MPRVPSPLWYSSTFSSTSRYWYKISSLPKQKSLYRMWECINQIIFKQKSTGPKCSSPTPQAGGKDNSDTRVAVLMQKFWHRKASGHLNCIRPKNITKIILWPNFTQEIVLYVEAQHAFKSAADTTFPPGLNLNSYAGSTSSYRGW